MRMPAGEYALIARKIVNRYAVVMNEIDHDIAVLEGAQFADILWGRERVAELTAHRRIIMDITANLMASCDMDRTERHFSTVLASATDEYAQTWYGEALKSASRLITERRKWLGH